MSGAPWVVHLYWEARLCGEAELLLEVHEPGGGVVHHILMPHADALLPRLHPHKISASRCLPCSAGRGELSAAALEIKC